MAADLHTHSTRSDGVLAPAELIRQAHAAGLAALALTDHDTLAGIDEARVAAATFGIRLLPGVELSVRDSERIEDHLLGLFVDPGSAELQAFLSELQAQRESMAQRTIDALAQLGVPVDLQRVHELARGAVVTRPHIARAMVEAGHVASEQEAFERFLGSGKPAAPPRPAPDPATAIRLVREAGGVSSLAHPVFPQDAEAAERLAGLPKRLDALVSAGLQGMECYYPDATPEVTKRLLGLARERNLVVTGGSDFHGPGKAPNAPLGQHAVDERVLRDLESARMRTTV
jgi:predicted metal-dependent phosphoesterase TrpH